MNDSEKQTIVFIPRNFIEKGTFMGGMFKIRNAIEGGILAVLIAVPVIQLPLSLTVRIIILCMTALPAAMISTVMPYPSVIHLLNLLEKGYIKK